jgi:hypothetical protein
LDVLKNEWTEEGKNDISTKKRNKTTVWRSVSKELRNNAEKHGLEIVEKEVRARGRNENKEYLTINHQKLANMTGS